MKKILLLATVCIGSIGFSQNINDNKISFAYIQLPTNPIDAAYSTYSVVVNPTYEQANEDSLNNYQMFLEAATIEYEGAMMAWREQKRTMYRTYLSQMAAWEKKKNAGTIEPEPVPPTYPEQPVMKEIREPHLHSEINQDMVNNSINMEGFSKAEGGAIVTVNMSPVSSITIKEDVKGSGSTTKYKYSCEYYMPIEVKVESPSQGVIANTILQPGVLGYGMKDYDSKYEYKLWLLDNWDQFWIDLETYARTRALKEVDDYLNNTCGFPARTHNVEIYSVKRHKDHDYTDVTNAYTTAVQGLQLIGKSKDRKQAAPKLKEAIAAWMKILEESNLNDNKSRVNDKITAMLQTNIGIAYLWLSDFNQATQYFNLAINSGEGKFKRYADDQLKVLEDQRLRWNANF